MPRQVRFILGVINSTLKVSNRKKADVEHDLEQQGFDRLPASKAWVGSPQLSSSAT